MLKSVGIATANKNRHSLSHIWNWVLGHGFVPEASSSPVSGLLINKRLAKKEKLERKAFTDADLSRILWYKEFQCSGDAPERYWLVLCLLLSGAPREEIAPLGLGDIQQDKDEIHFFDITNEGERRLKNASSSKRRVPVHSELIRVRFIEYVAAMKKRRAVRLFPQLQKGGNGYGDAVGKWFG